MKKFSKILSSVLASAMVISCLTINSFAAGKQHELTITPSKTEGLVAGETIVVEVSIDNTLNVGNLNLYLQYDATAFELDTTKPNGRGAVENYIDKDWFAEITNTSGNWGYYFKTPTYSPTSTVAGTAGEISFIYANAVAVEDGYDDNNLVVGKFNFKVKADAVDGDYTFTLNNSSTLDGDQSQKVMTTSTPVTVTVGSGAVEPPTPPAPSTPDAVKFYAVLPACKKAEASAVAQFQFDDTGDGVADKGYNYDLGSLTWDTDVTVGVEVTNIDDGVTLALTNVLWK